MSLMETLTLIGLIFTFVGLMVQIAVAVFNITWKISHEQKDNNRKTTTERKASNRLSFPTVSYLLSFFMIETNCW